MIGNLDERSLAAPSPVAVAKDKSKALSFMEKAQLGLKDWQGANVLADSRQVDDVDMIAEKQSNRPMAAT